MNYLDIFLALPLLWGAYKGFNKGLVIEAASLAALCLGIYGAIKFSAFTGVFLAENFDMNPKYLPMIAFAITFILIVVGVHFIAKALDKLVSAIALGFVNRLLGVGFGVMKFAFILSILLLGVNLVDSKLELLAEEKKSESLLYKPVLSIAPLIFPALNNMYEGVSNKSSIQNVAV